MLLIDGKFRAHAFASSYNMKKTRRDENGYLISPYDVTVFSLTVDAIGEDEWVEKTIKTEIFAVSFKDAEVIAIQQVKKEMQEKRNDTVRNGKRKLFST